MDIYAFINFSEQALSIKVGFKRKRGRPAKTASALQRQDENLQSESDVEMDENTKKLVKKNPKKKKIDGRKRK